MFIAKLFWKFCLCVICVVGSNFENFFLLEELLATQPWCLHFNNHLLNKPNFVPTHFRLIKVKCLVKMSLYIPCNTQEEEGKQSVWHAAWFRWEAAWHTVITVVHNVGQSVEKFELSLYIYSFIVMSLCPPVSPKYNNQQLMHVLSLQTDEVEINLRVREICINIILYVNVGRYRLSTSLLPQSKLNIHSILAAFNYQLWKVWLNFPKIYSWIFVLPLLNVLCQQHLLFWTCYTFEIQFKSTIHFVLSSSRQRRRRGLKEGNFRVIEILEWLLTKSKP